MAEFSADLNPKNNAMSLADMMKVGLYSAEADVLNRQAQVAREKEAELPLIKSAMADPENKLPDGSWNVKRLTQILPAIAPVSGAEYATKVIDMTKNHIEASKALNDLGQQERGILGGIYAAHAAAGTQDPAKVIASLNTLKQENPNLSRLIDLKVQALKDVQGGPQFNEKLYQARNETLTPTQAIDQFAPKAQISTIGGASRPVVTTPSVMGEQPKVTPTEFGGGGTTGGPAMAPKSNPKDRDLIKYDTYLDYKQDPALANYSDEQRAALESGKKLLQNSNMLANSAREQEANTRGVYENIAATSGSRPGQMVRQGGKWLVGNATLEMLNKNIERMAAASEVMGTAKTDASRETAKVINGSTDLTEKALLDIVSRADATVKAATMFNKAYNNLIEKRGVNGYIQAEKLKSAWADNFDVRMTQMDALAKSNAPDQKEKRQEIWNSIPKDDREDFVKRWENLHALEQGKFR
jgi:hypothetical protein